MNDIYEDFEGTAEGVETTDAATRFKNYSEPQAVTYEEILGENSGNEATEELVYCLSQQGYAEKIEPLTVEACRTYLRKKQFTTNSFLLSQLSNPLKAKIGEIQWLSKTNDVMLAMASELGASVTAVEKGENLTEIVAMANQLVVLCQNTPCYRFIHRIGDPGEHLMFSTCDAGQFRVAFQNLVISLRVRNFNAVGTFSKRPVRKFSSSTGIETLACRMATSESVAKMAFLVESTLAFANAPSGLASDSKNLVINTQDMVEYRSPADKNLVADYQYLSAMSAHNIQRLYKLGGLVNPVDAVSKEVGRVDVSILILSNFGVPSRELRDIFREHQLFASKVIFTKECEWDGDRLEDNKM